MADTDRRLNSWKEIAAYLQSDVRTAQRWEAEGLPVRRLRHDKLASVYAQTADIEAWLAARSGNPGPPSTVHGIDPAAPPLPELSTQPGMTRTLLIVAGAALAIVGSFLAATAAINASHRSAVAPDVSMAAATAFVRSGDFEAAEGVLRRLAARQPSDPVAEMSLASLLALVGKPAGEVSSWADRATNHISAATSLADDYYIRAGSARIHGDIDTAITLYRSALAANPNDYWSMTLLGDLYAEVGYDPFAVQIFARKSDIFPTDGLAATLATTALFQYGDYEGAMRYGQRVLDAPDANPYDVCWLRVMPAQVAWLKNDRRSAVALAAAAAAQSDLATWQIDEVKRRAAQLMVLAGDESAAHRTIATMTDGRWRRSELSTWPAVHMPDAPATIDLPDPVYQHDAAWLIAVGANAFVPAADVMETALRRANEPIAKELLQGKLLQVRQDPAALDHFLAAMRLGPMVHSPVQPQKLRIDTCLQFAGGYVGAVMQAMIGAAEMYSATGRRAEATRLLEQLSAGRAQALLADAPGISAWRRAQQLLGR